MKGTRLAWVTVVLVTLATGCGRVTGRGSGSGAIEHPSAPSDLVLRVETSGGFVPPELRLRGVPEFTLTGDGRTITEGPQIEIYPGPALPNLLVRSVDREGIQRILEEARDAGLLGPDRHYDLPTVADAPTTTFTVVAEGRRHVVSAYALGMELEDVGRDEPSGEGEPIPGGDEPVSSDESGVRPEDPGSGAGEEEAPGEAVGPGELGEDERGARRVLAGFRSMLFELDRWLPQGSIGEEDFFRFDELRIFVTERPAPPDEGLEQRALDWPLKEPLSAFGEPVPDDPAMRCGTVEGEALAELLPLAQQANQLTPWRSEGREFGLLFRPLLPDESGC